MHEQITSSWNRLLKAVIYCGTYALKEQEQVTRSYKSDGTVLTKTDLFIHSFLTDTLKTLYPSCGIISEESDDQPSFDREYYFVLDPIDGTDAYSQGMPSWCIAVGILDRELNPVGGIVYAPRWGVGTSSELLVTRIPGDKAYMGGEILEEKKFSLPVRQIAMSSNSHSFLRLDSFDGKVRTMGSTILHILAPILHSHIDIAVFTPCYIWDIAAGDGIVNSLGLVLRYTDGTPPDYRKLSMREKTAGIVFLGTEEILQSAIPLLSREVHEKTVPDSDAE